MSTFALLLSSLYYAHIILMSPILSYRPYLRYIIITFIIE
jgi:hypothetical protein